jgi:glycosyltransferase involved in cell wall biosynthesis
MSPIFAVIAWPFVRLRGAKLVLWYLHRSVTLKLKLALRLVDTLVTADKGSLNITNDKIVETGHGIDVKRFVVLGRDFDISKKPLNILSVGRLSPIKDFGTLIRAVAKLKEQGRDIRVHIVGRAVMSADRAHETQLRTLVSELVLGDIVEFVGFVPYRDMPAQYAWADVVVGGTPKGGLDKAILEGMAAGCVPFTSNEAMRPHLGAYAERLLYTHGNASDLALRLSVFSAYEAASRALAASVREHHALGRTVKHIVKYL